MNAFDQLRRAQAAHLLVIAECQMDWPFECIRVVDALPRGGLQMAERSLTGELGAVGESPVPIPRTPTSDREGDCVPEIDDARLPASLASSITLQISRSR